MNITALRRALSTGARRALTERGGLFVMTGFYLCVVAMVGSLWRAGADVNGGTVAGYTAVALFWYIAASEAVTVSLDMRMIDDIGTDIITGAITTEMLRPVSVVGLRIAARVGRALPRLFTCAAAGAVLSLVVVGRPPSWPALVLALPSLVLAIACNIAAQHMFAASAFWVRDARSSWFLYQKLVFILGGMLLPIEVLPGPLEATARVLPFSAMAYAPARIAAGHLDWWLLLVQLGWTVAAVTGAAAVFARGERRILAVGA